ncbi:MAG: 1,4-dihydroxy-2-naphthoate polyprenyltransferase [Acidimicrobiales bacterium]
MSDDDGSRPGPASAPLPAGWRRWVAGARPRTLPAAIVPVLVGTACAAGVPHGIDDGAAGLDGPLKGIVVWRFVAAAVVALAIQIGTNFANDYSDGTRGTDDPGQRVGPVRLVGWGLAEPRHVKAAAFGSFGVAGLAGLALAAAVGWWLILVGLVCFAAGWFYTGGRHPYGYYGFGELFVFVFFGLVATIGSAYVQTATFAYGDFHVNQIADVGTPTAAQEWALAVQRYPWLTVFAAVAVGCFATALLVVNNLRDIPSDTASGKKTLAVRIGDHRTRVLYTVLVVVPFVLVPLIAGLGRRPLAVAALFVVLLAQRPVLHVLRGDRGPALVPVLAATGRVQLVYGVLLAAGLFVSAPTP